jgi:hypothetical protein
MRIDRNWLGNEFGHAEEEADAGADSDTGAVDRSREIIGKSVSIASREAGISDQSYRDELGLP